jgi:hypothetical protein
MPAMKYRTIKNPPFSGSLTVNEAEESVRAIAQRASTKRFVTDNGNYAEAGIAVTANRKATTKTASRIRSSSISEGKVAGSRVRARKK